VEFPDRATCLRARAIADDAMLKEVATKIDLFNEREAQ
jgi:hypothetical protein